MKYQLNSNVRIVQFNEIFCFRKGIWDFNEATLDIRQESQVLKAVYCEMISALFKGQAIDITAFEERLDADDFAKLSQVIEALYYSDLLMQEDKYAVQENMMQILMGGSRFLAEDGQEMNTASILFISDVDFVNDSACELAKVMGVNIEVASDELKSKIQTTDVSSRLDALVHRQNMQILIEELKVYQAIVVCQERLNITMMRHLNEVIVSLKQQLIVGFVDGPFIHACTLNPPHTADCDSLERRVLARLQDHTLYQHFANQLLPPTQSVSQAFLPLLNILMNLVISEAFLVARTGNSKFEGRLLSIYLPTLEIQVQDILKMANSQTQGALAKLRYEDQQISTREIVRNLLREDKE